MLRYFVNYAKRVSVTEPEESDFPDKRQRDGIGREASVDVAIGKETSVAIDNKLLSSSGQRGCRLSEYIMAIVYYLTSLKALKNTSNLHENSGTVEYFAGQ